LADLSEEEVMAAAGKAMLASTFMPSCAELRAFVRGPLKSHGSEALEWWAALEHRDTTKRGYRDGLPEEVLAVFDLMGGCNWWNNMRPEDEPFERNRFVKLFEAQFQVNEDGRLALPEDIHATKEVSQQRREGYKPLPPVTTGRFQVEDTHVPARTDEEINKKEAANRKKFDEIKESFNEGRQATLPKDDDSGDA